MARKPKSQYKVIQKILEKPTFKYDALTQTAYGLRYGFTSVFKPLANHEIVLLLAASKNGEMPDVQELQMVIQSIPIIASISFEEYRFLVRFKKEKNADIHAENIYQGLDQLTLWMIEHGYQNCSEIDGVNGPTTPYSVRGNIMLLDERGYQLVNDEFTKQEFNSTKQENVVAGTVGGFLGSLVGAAAIVLIGQLGYISVLSGVIMAICCIKGYQLLAGGFSKKGIFITALLMIVVTYVSKRLDWAISIAQQLEIDVFTAYQVIPELLRADAIDLTSYISDFVMVYLFTIVGALPTFLAELSSNTIKSTIRKFD